MGPYNGISVSILIMRKGKRDPLYPEHKKSARKEGTVGSIFSLAQGRWNHAESSCWAKVGKVLGVSSAIHKVQKKKVRFPHKLPVTCLLGKGIALR